MSKYIQIGKITLLEYLTYRLNYVFWRIRSIIFFLTLFFFWLAIYQNTDSVFGYSMSQMFSYVIGIAFLRSVVFASRVGDLPGMIRDGTMTKYLMQPINVFSLLFFRDTADKLLNITFTIIELVIILSIFKFPFYIPHNLSTYFLFLIVTISAIFLGYFLNLFISLTAFWTEDPWSTRWVFGIVFLEFLGGSYFPIDVLPSWLAKIIYMTPFPYVLYFPLKIWNEQFSVPQTYQIIGICTGWAMIFYFLSKFLWKKGTKNYGAYGG